jgi:hypothetical protein
MIFEACRSAWKGEANLEIQASTLQLAVNHVQECLQAAGVLDSIALLVRNYIQADETPVG